MRIVMLSDQRGAADGFTLQDFRAGVAYDLTRTPRERELAAIFVRANFAREDGAEPPRPVLRLPLLDEYVKAGYPEKTYLAFLERETRAAELVGRRVEVRPMTAAELAAFARPPSPPVPPVPPVPPAPVAPPPPTVVVTEPAPPPAPPPPPRPQATVTAKGKKYKG